MVDLPIWSDEFEGTSLSYATDTGGGTWRTKGYEFQGVLKDGFLDAAGSSWNLSRDEAATYGFDPISVSNSVLTVKAARPSTALLNHIHAYGTYTNNVEWVGAYLVSNHLSGTRGAPLTWRYGYFEWRARFTNPARGMFPALWLFNNVAARSDGYEGAELDVLEIFGQSNGQPWASGWHARPSGTASISGGGTLEGNIGYWSGDDTTGWHRYGINWTSTAIEIYRDGVLKGSLSYSPAIQWMRNANMGVRINYAIDPNWETPWNGTNPSPNRTTPSDPALGYVYTMDVDYVRVFATKPTDMSPGVTDDPLAGLINGGTTVQPTVKIADDFNVPGVSLTPTVKIADDFNTLPTPVNPLPPYPRRAKIYVSGAWKSCAVRNWNGSAWVERQVHPPA